MRKLLYGLVASLIKVSFRLLGWQWLITGIDRIPASGPVVLAGNHVSYLDPIMVGYAVDRRGRQACFMAKRELFGIPGFGWLLRTLRMVPVDRAAGGRALPEAVEALSQGRIVVVFPEATITTSFVPADGKTGAARMAMAAGVPLLPVACWGGQRLFTKHRPRRLTRGAVLAVRVGEPVPYDAGEDPVDVTKRLMEAITDLVDQSARTYPGRASGPDDRWWLPRHLGGTAPTIQEAAELRAREAEERRRRRLAAAKAGQPARPRSRWTRRLKG